ncbi:MAG TPA: hypothetical protein VM305_04050 [Candidatus Limnocylindrales bacterium]|nr:hypothetical protein [Candidatus Limnocylindrales bacterium]HWI18718.1 hypothetical protein [Vicinamibacterales bacterium]
MTFPELIDVGALVLAVVVLVVAARLIYLVALRFIRPRLLIKDVLGPDGSPSQAMTGALLSEMHRLKEEGAGSGLNFVTGNDKDIELPKDVDLPKELGLLTSVANYFPGRISTVSVTAHAATARGFGVTISLNSSDTKITSIATLWEHDYFEDGDHEAADAERLHRMTLVAASWLVYRLMEQIGVEERLQLITQDWESYALFLIGSRLQQQLRLGEARSVYARALDRDPRNRGATFNLGVLDLLALDHDSAVQRFKAVVEEVTDEAVVDASPCELDRLWYRASYNLAAAHIHRWLESSDSAPTDLTEAKAKSLEVAKKADETISLLGGDAQTRLGGKYADLVRFLVVARNGALALYADAVRRR